MGPDPDAEWTCKALDVDHEAALTAPALAA